MAQHKLSTTSFLLVLLSGTLLPLALAPFSWWPTAIFSLSALSFLCRGHGFRGVFALCTVFGIGFYGVGASWVYVSIHNYGHASIALATLLTGLFVVAMALIFALPLSLLGLFHHASTTSTLLAFPALWVLGEWFRGWFLTGFPWLNVGYGFIDTWLAGWAPLFGVLSLSGVAASSAALLSLFGEYKKNKTILQKGLVVLILIYASGAYLQTKTWTHPTDKTLDLALVQPNLPLLEKWRPDELDNILSEFQKTTATLLDQDLVIWPESAIPTLQNNILDFLSKIDSTLKENHVGLLSGIPTNINSKVQSTPATGQYRNSVISLGQATGSYHKRRLVPFGEYVPMERWLRGTIAFFDLPMSAFSAGAEQQRLIHLGTVQIATAICYEIAYPDLIARDAANANILLTVSNDTWFGDSIGPHQHLQMARMRALENAKPLLRASNDGFSVVISPRGNITEQLPRFEAGILKTQIRPYTGSTPFSRWGSFLIVSLSFSIIILLFLIRGLRS